MIHLTRITRIMAELASEGVPRQACPAMAQLQIERGI